MCAFAVQCRSRRRVSTTHALGQASISPYGTQCRLSLTFIAKCPFCRPLYPDTRLRRGPIPCLSAFSTSGCSSCSVLSHPGAGDNPSQPGAGVKTHLLDSSISPKTQFLFREIPGPPVFSTISRRRSLAPHHPSADSIAVMVRYRTSLNNKCGGSCSSTLIRDVAVLPPLRTVAIRVATSVD